MIQAMVSGLTFFGTQIPVTSAKPRITKSQNGGHPQYEKIVSLNFTQYVPVD